MLAFQNSRNPSNPFVELMRTTTFRTWKGLRSIIHFVKSNSNSAHKQSQAYETKKFTMIHLILCGKLLLVHLIIKLMIGYPKKIQATEQLPCLQLTTHLFSVLLLLHEKSPFEHLFLTIRSLRRCLISSRLRGLLWNRAIVIICI